MAANLTKGGVIHSQRIFFLHKKASFNKICLKVEYYAIFNVSKYTMINRKT
jgi:hypothetical protein